MSAGLPQVKRVRPRANVAVYALLAVISALLVAIAFLVFGGSLFDDTPTTDLERDYQQLVEGLKANPDNPAVLMTLAEVEYLMGKKGDAFDHAARASELSTSSAGIPMRYSVLLLQEGRYDDALVWIDREIELTVDDNAAEPKFVKAQVLWALDQRDEAIDLLGEALEVGYTAADLRILYADWLAQEGRDAEAIEQYQTALQFLPGDERAIAGLESLGETYEASATVDPHGSGSE